jgi:hypothetical protein
MSAMQPRVPADMGNARAGVVNRTHRILRDEALKMREKKEKSRSLWVPLGIFSILMLVLCYSIWFVLDGYDLTPSGVPDASDQMMLLVLWSLPVTCVLLGVAFLKRGRGLFGSSNEVSR